MLMKMLLKFAALLIWLTGSPFFTHRCQAQTANIHIHDHALIVEDVEPQPLMAQAKRVSEALAYVGSPLPLEATERLSDLSMEALSKETVHEIQKILDPYCLAIININPEARVKVEKGQAEAVLHQHGWKTFLVKIHNEPNLTAHFDVESPNAHPVFHKSTSHDRMKEENRLTKGQVDNRFLEIAMYNDRPMQHNLSGLELEYAILQVYSRTSGKKEAELSFNAGPGTQDIGFRNAVNILFDVKPSVKVKLNVKDHDGTPTMASFIFMDGIDRFKSTKEDDPFPDDYRLTQARHLDWERDGSDRKTFRSEEISTEKRLRGIYPLPSRRLAWTDEYPDLFFQAQIYRADGEHINLPPGDYTVIYTRGPEYLEKRTHITVPEGKTSVEISFRLERWAHMAKLGWYSGDHHIHAAGCSHYESPEEGVKPEHMWRQIQGEDLNFGSNLAWGPCWYYQKEYFTGDVYPLSNSKNLMRYDVEVSGFPSSHAGHLVLMNLEEDDYPNTTKIEEWPTWTLPILQWAKNQGGVVGYAHSGWGLQPVSKTSDLPNYVLPEMSGIGANEYVVTVAHDAVDLYSLGDTPPAWELNMWYHTLSSGFRVRASGETDFPCISDEKVGRARIYAKLDKGLNFDDFMEATKEGNSYVSTGAAHIIDYKINDVMLGDGKSELNVKKGTNLNISFKVAAFLKEEQDEIGAIIASRQPVGPPHWHAEKARIGKSRKVPVELIVNGEPVAKQEIEADGAWQNLTFNYEIDESSWVALRILPAVHTNPIFVLVERQPIQRAKSAQWCLDAVDQCWKTKSARFRDSEIEEAEKAYEHARKVYREILESARKH